VIDGAVRDAGELRESGFSVYARGVVPNGPHKGFGGSLNRLIQCAGASVEAGDLIVGDEDGVVVIRSDQRSGLMERCKGLIEPPHGFACLGNQLESIR
jgi:regulator of RNase E activity RraA